MIEVNISFSIYGSKKPWRSKKKKKKLVSKLPTFMKPDLEEYLLNPQLLNAGCLVASCPLSNRISRKESQCLSLQLLLFKSLPLRVGLEIYTKELSPLPGHFHPHLTKKVTNRLYHPINSKWGLAASCCKLTLSRARNSEHPKIIYPKMLFWSKICHFPYRNGENS